MSGPEKVRTALAMQDAGYHAPFDYRDVAALLSAYDKAAKALRELYEWYDRDGSVGGASLVFEKHRSALLPYVKREMGR